MLFTVLDHRKYLFKDLHRIVRFLLAAAVLDFVKETAVGTGVACRADLCYFCKDCIQIAVRGQRMHILIVSAGFSL